MRNINYVRLYKDLLLLIELVRSNRGKIIECYYNNKEMSSIKQQQYRPINKLLTPNQYKLWNNFKTWLRVQRRTTNYDFEDKIQQRWKINYNDKIISIISDKEEIYKQIEITEECKLMSNPLQKNLLTIGIISRKYNNSIIKIIY